MEMKKYTCVGTYDEHLERLLETHTCLCQNAREIIEILIKDMKFAKKQEGVQDV